MINYLGFAPCPPKNVSSWSTPSNPLLSTYAFDLPPNLIKFGYQSDMWFIPVKPNDVGRRGEWTNPGTLVPPSYGVVLKPICVMNNQWALAVVERLELYKMVTYVFIFSIKVPLYG